MSEGSLRHRSGIRVVLVGACLLGAACKPSGPDTSADRTKVLETLGGAVIPGAVRDFAAKAEALEAAAGAYASALAGPAADVETRQAAARQAFRDAMGAWQLLEVMQVGPAAPKSRAIGGEGLRDEIYSWPTVNPCRVDQATHDRDFEAEGWPAGKLPNVYGLDAAEYLLFRADAGNACADTVPLNANGTWVALGEDEIARRRAAYAHAALKRVAADARLLRDRWDPAQGNWGGQLATAGAAGSAYTSAQEGLDDVFAGLFYLDKEVKDQKLALPSGIDPACAAETCPEHLESRSSGLSKENVRANLVAARRLFLGNDPGEEARFSFDDLLGTLNAAALATQMAAALDDAIAAADAIPGTLEAQLATDPAPVRTLHAKVKAFTDLMKSQFVTVLNLRVPQEGAADND